MSSHGADITAGEIRKEKVSNQTDTSAARGMRKAGTKESVLPVRGFWVGPASQEAGEECAHPRRGSWPCWKSRREAAWGLESDEEKFGSQEVVSSHIVILAQSWEGKLEEKNASCKDSLGVEDLMKVHVGGHTVLRHSDHGSGSPS